VNLHGKYPNEMVLRPRVGVVINVPSIERPVERPTGPPGGAPPSLEERRRRVSEETAKLKQFLREAKAYAEMKARVEKAGAASAAGRDAALEAMLPVMRGEAAAICVADHFREIRAAVALGDEFGMKVIIAGGAEAAKVAGLLKEKDVPVLYSAIYSLPRTASDPYDVNFATPEVLRRAGVRFAIVTASSADVRSLPYEAAHAAAYGLEREDALKAISLWPAEILGIAGKVGSLEAGKLANLLVTRGDPLDVRSEVRYVFIEGKIIPLESRNTEQADKFAQ
jgi:imidazolonepropionase-like amidohydrolase